MLQTMVTLLSPPDPKADAIVCSTCCCGFPLSTYPRACTCAWRHTPSRPSSAQEGFSWIRILGFQGFQGCVLPCAQIDLVAGMMDCLYAECTPCMHHHLSLAPPLSMPPLCAQIDLVAGMMDCLYAECTPCITDCVVAELEKLGQKYRVALKVAKVRPVHGAPQPAGNPLVEFDAVYHAAACSL